MARKIQTKSVAKLPQVGGEVWEVGRRTLDISVEELERKGEQPELLLAVQPDERGGIVRGDAISSSGPPNALADFILLAMNKPLIGKPRRPEVIRVGSQAEAEALAETLAAVGVTLEVSPSLTTLDAICEQMQTAFGGFSGDYRSQAARSGESLSEEGLRELFLAAAEFHEAELWLDFGEDELFEIEFQPAQGPSKTLYGVMMGSMEQEFGLALYYSLDDLQQIYEINEQHHDQLIIPPEEFHEEELDSEELQEHVEMMAKLLLIPSVSLTYTPRRDVPPPLVQEVKQLKLPLADKSAFPLVMRTGQGHLQLGTVDDLRDMTLAVKAVLDWDDQISEMDVLDELGVTITTNLAPVADFFPETTIYTTLRENPFASEETEDLLPPEFADFLDALLTEPPGRKPSAKSGKSSSGKKKKPAGKKATAKTTASTLPRIYTLDVYLTDGPVPRAYEGKVISRKIQILGEQTLHELHEAIFDAYDRFEEHLYEFNLGEGPRDRSEVYFYSGGWDAGDEGAGDPEETTIDSLDLEVGQRFGYVFDMGDYWEHVVEVITIEEGSVKGRYPRVIEKAGASPPQYPDDDEEE
jgi:hypothetical protein